MKGKARLTALACAIGVAMVIAQVHAQSTLPLVQKSNLVHLGSFHVPTGQKFGGADAEYQYGGTALGFDPTRNALFLVGHDWDQLTGEISIPALGGTSTLLQSLTDAAEGRSVGSSTQKVGGNLVYEGKLYFTKYLYYDASGSQVLSHFVRPLNLSTKGQVQGPYAVGPLGAGFYSGYMALVPPEWQSALGGPALTGNSDLSIISRTSYGPAVFAFDPAKVGVSKTAVPLVYYPGDHPLAPYGAKANPYFTGADAIRGVVLPDGTRSVLFFGRHGTGDSCYGEPSDCGDPTCSSCKGDHSYPYVPYVWAYDANDLAAVKSGKKQPWDVKPYATWALDLPDTGQNYLGGAAFDPTANRLYVSQMSADGDNPVIQVFTITNSVGAGPAPTPPSNVRIIK
ncbi:MAG TPA: hypothetical protein VFX12_00715 [Vicinamibacterales bacterium]|nr:hypothetical protein [Vicinamibacterales bacterium]